MASFDDPIVREEQVQQARSFGQSDGELLGDARVLVVRRLDLV
ncbi:MAG TPA: hypothetical protein VJP45_13535 [Candidatus Limnocylindria bacterium]|nr:hypothetical protein [Candidatus Limnocylindria bacterium]